MSKNSQNGRGIKGLQLVSCTPGINAVKNTVPG